LQTKNNLGKVCKFIVEEGQQVYENDNETYQAHQNVSQPSNTVHQIVPQLELASGMPVHKKSSSAQKMIYQLIMILTGMRIGIQMTWDQSMM